MNIVELVRLKRIDHSRLRDVAPDRDSVSGDRGPGRMPSETDLGANFRPEDHWRRWLQDSS